MTYPWERALTAAPVRVHTRQPAARLDPEVQDYWGNVCLTAAGKGHLDIVKEVCDMGLDLHRYGTDLLTVAAARNQSEVLAELLSRGVAYHLVDLLTRIEILRTAIRTGQNQVVVDLCPLGFGPGSDSLVDLAITRDNIDALQLLRQHGAQLKETTLYFALALGQLRIIDYLLYWVPRWPDLSTECPPYQQMIAEHGRYRRTRRFDQHYTIIQRCDPGTARIIYVLHLIYRMRAGATIQALPYEMVSHILQQL